MIVNFARLFFYAVTLLRYSRKEARFLLLSELLAQFEEYCAFHGIETPAYADEAIIPQEAI